MSQPLADQPPPSRAPAQRDGLEVVGVDCALVRVPLGRPIAGASARPGVTPKPFTIWDLISATVRTKSGLTGWGLTYELRAGGEAGLAALHHDLVPLVIGADRWASERLWHRLYWARRIETRIATGQTVTTRFEIQPLLDRRAVDVGLAVHRQRGTR